MDLEFYKKKFDLTTREGFDNIAKVLMLANPILGFPLYAIHKLFGSAPSAEEQVQTVEKLIKQAKQDGAEEITVEMSGDAHAKLEGSYDGTSVSTDFGSNGNVKVTVKFDKNA